MFYFEIDGEPVAAADEDFGAWGDWFEKIENRRVAYTEINGYVVSTVFLGIDHGFVSERPVLYETMIFGHPKLDVQRRYCTRAEAKAGHGAVVKTCALLDGGGDV